MFLNAVPMCISNNCVEFAVSLIEQSRDVKLQKMNEWLSAFAMISNPSDKMIALVAVSITIA